MSGQISKVRLVALSVVYALNFVGLGVIVWPDLIGHEGTWDAFHGVAFSFWAALSLLMGLGIRYPLKLLPILLIQLLYKSIWLLAVWLPMWSAGKPIALTRQMVMGVVVDLLVIPWSYVFATYVKSAGDRPTQVER